LTASLLVGAMAVLGYVLVRTWPAGVVDNARLFVLVVCAGALGGTLHAIRSLYWYVGNRSLRGSWLLMYGVLPLVGAAMALVTYLMLRGGLTVGPSASTINPYGITAVSALVGLFSQEAVAKLRVVFAALLAPAEKGKDQVLSAAVNAVVPGSGPVGQEVAVLGRGLSAARHVRFGALVAPIVIVSDGELRTAVPVGAASGHLVVVTASGVVAGPDAFTVTEA
jgi:hypothetical protein